MVLLLARVVGTCCVFTIGDFFPYNSVYTQAVAYTIFLAWEACVSHDNFIRISVCYHIL